MRKLFCILMIVALIAGFSVGVAAKETIIFYHWEDPTLQQVIDAFNNSQDEVFVEPQVISAADYGPKMTTLLAGGSEMDAFMVKGPMDIFPYVENGYVEPLDDLIAKHGYDLTQISAYERAYKIIDGKVYQLPFRGASWFVYFNKKVFEAAGVPTPDTYVEKGEWTWEKYAEVAKQLSSGDGKVYGAFEYYWAPCNFIPAIQRGKQFINPDGMIDIDDSVLFSFKRRKELEEAKAMMPQVEIKATKTHYSQGFYQGNVGMLIIGSWFPGYMIKARDENLLKGFTWDDWSVTRIPCNEPEYRTINPPTSNVVHADSKKKDAAFKFVAWMAGGEAAALLAEAGLYPSQITPAVKEALAKALPDESSLKYFVEDKIVMPQFYNKYGSQLDGKLGGVMEQYLTNDMTDDEIMSALKDVLQEIIDTTM